MSSPGGHCLGTILEPNQGQISNVVWSSDRHPRMNSHVCPGVPITKRDWRNHNWDLNIWLSSDIAWNNAISTIIHPYQYRYAHASILYRTVKNVSQMAVLYQYWECRQFEELSFVTHLNGICPNGIGSWKRWTFHQNDESSLSAYFTFLNITALAQFISMTLQWLHMSAMASELTGNLIIWSTVVTVYNDKANIKKSHYGWIHSQKLNLKSFGWLSNWHYLIRMPYDQCRMSTQRDLNPGNCPKSSGSRTMSSGLTMLP